MLKKVSFAEYCGRNIEPDNTGHNDEIEEIVNRLELFKGEEGTKQMQDNDQEANTKEEPRDYKQLYEELQAKTETDIQQTAILSKQIQSLRKSIRELIPNINVLISACEQSQSKSAFTLQDAHNVFTSIQQISSILTSAQPNLNTNTK